MPLPAEVRALAGAQRRRQQIIAAQLARIGQQEWSRLDPADLRGSWAAVSPTVLALTNAAAASAARGAQEYVATSLQMQGATPDPAGTVSMAPLAGAASDGRPLSSLLDSPLYEALALIGQGIAVDEALSRAGGDLTMILTTQVQDASRVAVGVGQVNDRAAVGWVRQTTPPSCSRCIILAGRYSSVQTAFRRHPRCDCVNVPTAEVIEPESPRRLYDQMTDAQRRQAGWTKADQQAIDDGADIYQVTNAHRGLQTVSIAGRDVRTTTQGATRRGLAGKRLGAPSKRTAVRLTPEQIYSDADRYGWSRDELIRQLTRNGYIL